MGRKLVITGTKLTDTTAPKLVAAYALDDFNRADGAAGSTPVGGLAWTAVGPDSWTISGNRLKGPYPVTNANAGSRMLVDTAKTVHYAQAHALTSAVYVLAGANADGSGYMAGISAGKLNIFNTTATSIGTSLGAWDVATTTTYTLGIFKNGSTISAYYNGTLAGTVTHTAVSGTRAGVLGLNMTDRYIDDFKVLEKPAN